MGVKFYKPTSAGRRGMTGADYSNISTERPPKHLVAGKKQSGGRDTAGRIAVRFRGGGHKRKLRVVDFRRDKVCPARVVRIDYDPNRSAHLALLQYEDGDTRYILAPENVRIGDRLKAGPGAEIRPGNHLLLKDIPLGTEIHNIELRPGKGGQIARSAGGYAQLMAKDGEYVLLRLRSGEVRKVLASCAASIGKVGNAHHELISIGKAGRSRWLGRMPHNRGVVMNPVDHPHGGGEGKTSGGRHPVSPWGQPAKGYRTRLNKRTDNMIVKRRNSK